MTQSPPPRPPSVPKAAPPLLDIQGLTVRLQTPLGRLTVLDQVRAPAHPYTQLLLSSIPARSRSGGFEPVATDIEKEHAELPDAANPPLGCAFAPRCPHAMAACQASAPALAPRQLAPTGTTALVACHLLALAHPA